MRTLDIGDFIYSIVYLFDSIFLALHPFPYRVSCHGSDLRDILSRLFIVLVDSVRRIICTVHTVQVSCFTDTELSEQNTQFLPLILFMLVRLILRHFWKVHTSIKNGKWTSSFISSMRILEANTWRIQPQSAALHL